MHLLNAARTRFECVPFVHEVAAGIAAEYFNESCSHGAGRAFALVTAGPGLTNIITALAGAFLESRQLLVIGGQVKTSDLARGEIRQRGIQEVDGVALASPVSKVARRIEKPLARGEFVSTIRQTSSDRPGPVFIEICLDVQGAPVNQDENPESANRPSTSCAAPERLEEAVAALSEASRPLLLLGGGVSRDISHPILDLARRTWIPCATTWNGADRVPANEPLYAGRPNTWGMRWSNLVLQQADVVVAAGTRLGLQQTGFNWQQFAPSGRVIQIDIDSAELQKGHPKVDFALHADVNSALPQLLQDAEKYTSTVQLAARKDWLRLIKEIRQGLPLSESGNSRSTAYLNPFDFVQNLSEHIPPDAVIVPCSSGGAFTVSMQSLLNKEGQIVITDKGLASMGYGLSGAIGAALGNRDRTVVLIEGDGGFAQNLQELGTLAAQKLNVKIFIFANQGYASIRMTQRNYFGGSYVGCDVSTGLGIPSWSSLFTAYAIPSMELSPQDVFNVQWQTLFCESGPAAFIVPVDPEQTYFPKISSRITADGSMQSDPLHRMTPELDPDSLRVFAPHLTSLGKGDPREQD